MNTRSQAVYASWARQLELRGLSQPAGFLLQIFSPASYLFFQFFLLGQPLLKSMLQTEQHQALADLLDDDSTYQSFARLLLHPEDQSLG